MHFERLIWCAQGLHPSRNLQLLPRPVSHAGRVDLSPARGAVREVLSQVSATAHALADDGDDVSSQLLRRQVPHAFLLDWQKMACCVLFDRAFLHTCIKTSAKHTQHVIIWLLEIIRSLMRSVLLEF